MKRLFYFIFPVILLFSCTLSAMAAEPYKPYIPEELPFAHSSWTDITLKTDMLSFPGDTWSEFMNVFHVSADSPKTGVFILVATQEYKTKFWSDSSDHGADRNWTVTLLYPSDVVNFETNFGSFACFVSKSESKREAHPIRVSAGPSSFNPSSFKHITLQYNYEKGTFSYFSSGDHLTWYQFTYVIDSSVLSNPVPSYPGYRTLAERYNFDTSLEDPKGNDRHYNWWLNTDNAQPPLPPKPPFDGDLDVDTDGDGEPDINVDTDKDGEPDINIDTDNDDKPDTNIDTDKDGKPDINVDTDKDGKPDTNIDTDKDGKPDINIDTDKDGKPDINVDTNGDGKPDINIDTDKDGKPDINVDTDKDGKPDINIDTDNDGKPDKDLDGDGDGLPDTGGGHPGGSPGDGGGSGNDPSSPDYGDNWFYPDADEPSYNDFPIFDPFSYDNYEKPSYNDPFGDYDPLEGYNTQPTMPDFSVPPSVPYEGYNPFINPWK